MSKVETFPLPTRPTLKVFRDSPMSLHTTWRIGGPADFLIRVPTQDDLLAAVQWANEEEMPVTVIGGGSNLLAPDAGIRGVVSALTHAGRTGRKLIRNGKISETPFAWRLARKRRFHGSGVSPPNVAGPEWIGASVCRVRSAARP